MNRYFITTRCLYILTVLSAACSDQLTGTFFKPQYPHQRYQRKLETAGLGRSVLYRQWFEAAVQSLADPAVVTVPYQEAAYIPADRPRAIGYFFQAKEGERLYIEAAVQPADSAQLFIDLFEAPRDTSSDLRHLVSADTMTTQLTWDVRRDGQYLLRVQPELLASISFQLRITAEPSLANPVAPGAAQHIGSIFGDARDGGSRAHEGIDIFAARLTPVLAATDGRVTRVGNNRLGGKVVWLRPADGRPINLYYAHLDTQLVTPGQAVRAGDTLGLIGNTGNARTTPPHLHLGIYGPNGAVDPLPFIRPGKSTPPPIQADMTRNGDTLRITADLRGNVSTGTPAVVEATAGKGYRIVLPNGIKRSVNHTQTTRLTALRTMKLARERILYAEADTTKPQITRLSAGQQVGLLGQYGQFLLVSTPVRGWILR